jgi:hypothetical protein
MELLRLLDAAKSEPGAATSLVSRQSAMPVLVLQQQEM